MRLYEGVSHNMVNVMSRKKVVEALEQEKPKLKALQKEKLPILRERMHRLLDSRLGWEDLPRFARTAHPRFGANVELPARLAGSLDRKTAKRPRGRGGASRAGRLRHRRQGRHQGCRQG